MPTQAQPTKSDARAELQAWYLESLQPKLARAAAAGVAPSAAVLALDEQVRAFIGLPLDDAAAHEFG